MKIKLKLIALIVALAFFVVPSVSANTYVPEYLEYSGALVENWETVVWDLEETVVEGEACHYYYEEDGAEFNWYYSLADGYTAQWGLYTDAVTGDGEYFSYVGALDESYEDIYEQYSYDFGFDQLEYSYFYDGSYTFEDFWDILLIFRKQNNNKTTPNKSSDTAKMLKCCSI